MVTASEEQIKEWQRTKTVGIIGLGDMGIMYAKRFSDAGWKVCGCDREDRFEDVKMAHGNYIEVVPNGHFVSRKSDYIIYSVEAENIDKIVSIYGPSTKLGAVVGGQTSCKRPEIEAFEKYLPEDVDIISVHSLHGPKVSPIGQPLVIIKHRANEGNFEFVKGLMSCLQSKEVFLTFEQHDRITADTQAVTHAAFLSMGCAWHSSNQYPWETPKWIGGMENAKINISLRIFANKWHVYAGLAITNPSAAEQISQYSKSTMELFTLMIQGRKEELQQRIMIAKEKVFGHLNLQNHRLLLDDDILQQYSLGKTPPSGKSQPNSHLSLLAIVDSWSCLGIVPYDHMICSTPLFRIFLGVTEYLFCTPGLVEDSINASINETSFRQDDLAFVIASKEWSNLVSNKDFQHYKQKFKETQDFFMPMIPEANRIGNEMIKTILQRVKDYESQ